MLHLDEEFLVPTKVYVAECELKKLFLPNGDFEGVIALCDDTLDAISKKGKKS